MRSSFITIKLPLVLICNLPLHLSPSTVQVQGENSAAPSLKVIYDFIYNQPQFLMTWGPVYSRVGEVLNEVVKRYNFAMAQCLLIFVAAAALLTFGALKFMEAHDSVQDPYKPYKVDGRDEYFRNKELRYKLPIHYFLFEIGVNETDFYSFYE